MTFAQWHCLSRRGAEVELAFEEKHVVVQKNMKWRGVFQLRSICGAEHFHAAHFSMRPWTLGLQGRKQLPPRGLREPPGAISILPVLGDKHSPVLGNLPKGSYLVFA